MRTWFGAMAARYRSQHLIINLGFKKIVFVGGRRLSEAILQDAPSEARFVAGRLKRESMSFLAPQALTIAHGEHWVRLRAFNESVLDCIRLPSYRREFFDRVREAFDHPVTSLVAIRHAMSQVMLGVVFGSGAALERLADDVQVLFGVVQSPLKRKLLGFRYAGSRARFYQALRQCWDQSSGSDRPSLLRRAREVAEDESADTLIQQFPHWMFPFTGSATDLIARTLALVMSRPEACDKAKRELSEAGSLNDAETIGRLPYVEACVLESGRLFPPVQFTLHCAQRDQDAADCSIPAGVDIVQYLPQLHRSSQRDPHEDRFQPERWLDGSPVYSDLFLRGARACPGRDLILFVCKTAIALQIGVYGVTGGVPQLRDDPLPISWPRDAFMSLSSPD